MGKKGVWKMLGLCSRFWPLNRGLLQASTLMASSIWCRRPTTGWYERHSCYEGFLVEGQRLCGIRALRTIFTWPHSEKNRIKKQKTKHQVCWSLYTRLNNVIVHIHVSTNHSCLCWHECVRLEEGPTSYSQGCKLWLIWFHIMQWRIFITAPLLIEMQT